MAYTPAVAQETLPPPYQRDGEIYFDDTPSKRVEFGGAVGASHCIQLNRSVEFRGRNRRTVGNGRIGQTVDENGALLNPETLIEDGLLARKAFIRVTTFGKDARKSGARSSKVHVNGCVAEPDLVFYYGPATSRRTYPQRLRVDASCLRYGTRSSDDAEQPEPKENWIRIETAEMLPDDLANECGDHGWSGVRAYLEGETLWWDQQIYPHFLVQRLAPFAAGGGEENARLWTHHTAMIVEFEALAPIALVHGYTSDIGFWNRAVANPDGETIDDAFMTPLVLKFIAFERISTRGSVKKSSGQPNIYPSTVDQIGGDIVEELKKLATRHGADYVNVVSHSLGAIWTRAALDKLATVAEPEFGVYNVVTLAGAHNGSVLGDIQHVLRQNPDEGSAYRAVNFPKKVQIAERVGGVLGITAFDESVRDATSRKAQGYAGLALPTRFLVKGKETSSRFWSLPTSFNINENCDADGYDAVECDNPNECKRYKGALFLSRRDVLKERSRLIQGYKQVVLAPPGQAFPPEARSECGDATSPGNGIVRACLIAERGSYPTPGCNNRKPLNDFTLRTAGMEFPGFTNLASQLRLPTGAGPYLLYNHSTIAHSAVANALLRTVLNAAEQEARKR